MDTSKDIIIIDSNDILKPMFDFFKVKHEDKTLIGAYQKFLNKLIENKDMEVIKDFLVYSKPFSFFLSENLYSYFDFSKGVETISGTKIKETELTYYINSLGEFCLFILSNTRDYDELIKYFLTSNDLLYYIGKSTRGKEIICNYYDIRGLDFFLNYTFNDEKVTASKNSFLFTYADLIYDSLIKFERNEEAKLVLNELENRKKGLTVITNTFSRSEPKKTFENLRVYSERFWIDYLSPDIFHKLHSESKSDLIESIVSEELIKQKILTNTSQIALALCKVIERELNIYLFDPYIQEFITCSVKPIANTISKTQKRKVKSRLLTLQTSKNCAFKGQRMTLGQIIFLMRFWNDKFMNEYSDLFHLIKEKNKSFENLTKAIEELLNYLVLKNGEYTLLDIRNSSAHPTLDDNINWEEHIEWIKKMLGKPPKEILKRIINNLKKE